jgi:hypothetical protein
MFQRIAFAIATVACFASVEAQAAGCPIDRAVYGQPGNAGVTAGFAHQRVRSDYASDLVFWVKSGAQMFWFSFASPNGYGGTYISPQIDPRLVRPTGDDGETPDARLPAARTAGQDAEVPSIAFDAFSRDLKAYGGPPQSADPAPAYLFSRQLGAAFHYNHNAYTLGPQTETVGIDIAFWRPLSCAAKPF